MTLLHSLQPPPRRSPVPRGMTLLEIMVVITIMGVVMAAVGVAVIPMLDAAKADTTRTTIMSVETGLKLYNMRHGKYPDTSGGIQTLVQEKILERTPKDGWGNDFVFLNEGGKYQIISYGADQSPGGEGKDADINSSTMNEAKRK